MIFYWLALLALTFAIFGFLLHAFYFARRKSVEEDLKEEIQNMKKALALREKMNADAQTDLAHARDVARSLDHQLEQRNQQMSALQNMARKQEGEIRILQQAASEIRLSIAGAEDNSAAAARDPEPSGPHPAEEGPERKIPLWKDNLNNILSMLDKLEKQTGK